MQYWDGMTEVSTEVTVVKVWFVSIVKFIIQTTATCGELLAPGSVINLLDPLIGQDLFRAELYPTNPAGPASAHCRRQFPICRNTK